MTHRTCAAPRPPARTAAALPLAVLASAALALAACGGGSDAAKPKAPDPGPLPPGTHALAAADRLPDPPVTERCYSPPTRTVFHTAKEWSDYWTGVTNNCPAPPIPAGVDFAKEMLVYAAIGRRESVQDRISIDGTGIRNDSVIVVIRRTMVQAECPGPAQATYPQSLVKLPADTRPVHFSEAHVKIPCDGADGGSGS